MEEEHELSLPPSDPVRKGREDFPGIGGAFALLLVLIGGTLAVALPLTAAATLFNDSPGEIALFAAFQSGMSLAILWGWRRTGLPFREVFSIRPVPKQFPSTARTAKSPTSSG